MSDVAEKPSKSRFLSRVSRWVRARSRILIVLSVAFAVLAAHEMVTATRAHIVDDAIATRLQADEALVLAPGSVRWVDGGPSPFALREIIFLAHEAGGAPDVYLAAVRAT